VGSQAMLELIYKLHAFGSDTPMAMHLASAGPIVSLIETYATGTMWSCIERVCGSHSTGGRPVNPPTAVGLWRTPQHDWYAGRTLLVPCSACAASSKRRRPLVLAGSLPPIVDISGAQSRH